MLLCREITSLQLFCEKNDYAVDNLKMKQTKLPFSRKIVPDLPDPSFSEDESDSEGMVSEYESADEDDAFEEEQEVPESEFVNITPQIKI